MTEGGMISLGSKTARRAIPVVLKVYMVWEKFLHGCNFYWLKITCHMKYCFPLEVRYFYFKVICILISCKNAWIVICQCSQDCGGGEKRRQVVCITPKASCPPEQRPPDTAPCNTHVCPEWSTGDWGHVSSSLIHRHFPLVKFILHYRPDCKCLDHGLGG